MRAVALALCLLACAATSARADNWVTPTPGGTIFNVPVKSLVALRYKDIVRQSADLSCGAAALATLLRYYYGDDLTEADVIRGAISVGDKEKIHKYGFSMLELKRYSEKLGFESEGFRVDDVNNLKDLKIPVLALVNNRGYNHFVVLKGVADGKVLLADPAFGNRARPLDGFQDEFGNAILAVVSQTLAGDPSFRHLTTLSGRAYEVNALLDFGVSPSGPLRGDF